MKEKSVTGILWWKPDQWEKAKRISDDTQRFDDSYKEWKNAAEEALKNFKDLRIKVYIIEIELNEYLDWCKEQNLPLNASSRSRFVSTKVQEHHPHSE